MPDNLASNIFLALGNCSFLSVCEGRKSKAGQKRNLAAYLRASLQIYVKIRLNRVKRRLEVTLYIFIMWSISYFANNLRMHIWFQLVALVETSVTVPQHLPSCAAGTPRRRLYTRAVTCDTCFLPLLEGVTTASADLKDPGTRIPRAQSQVTPAGTTRLFNAGTCHAFKRVAVSVVPFSFGANLPSRTR